MSIKEIETGYETLYKAVEQYQNEQHTYFFHAYLEVIKALNTPDMVWNSESKVPTYLEPLQTLPLLPEEKRKVSQLVLLKGMTLEPLQPNHQLTPDSIGFLFVYLIERLKENKKKLSIYDPTVGMGNLLYTIMLNLQLAGIETSGFGAEIDDLLIEIAATDADWFELPVRLFHQDGVQPILIDPCDFVVADLPIGYYPLDEKVTHFKSSVTDGHSYAHHVLMEASMKALNSTGYGLFLVPSQLLSSEQADALKTWLSQDVYIQALLHLPSGMFKSEASQKSILILQNRNQDTKQVKEVLVAEIPDLMDKEGLQRFFSTFAAWHAEQKGE